MADKKDSQPDELTPSAYALDKVGPAKANESKAALNERAERYAAAKAERRWG